MFMRMVSHPGQILIVDGWCPILVMAPELQEDGMVQVLFIGSISEFLKSSRIRKPGATRCHGTRGCKRCPSTSLYEFLSLNF